MTEKELDILMYRVLRDSLYVDWAFIENKEALFNPSNRYIRQMIAMLRNPLRWAKHQATSMPSRILRTVAVIALILFLGFASVLTASPTARAAISEWVQEIYSKFIIFHYYGGYSANEQKYRIKSLPEGFVEVDQMQSDTTTMYIYQNPEGEMIVFSYVTMDTGVISIFTTENDDIRDVKVNGYDGKFISPMNPENMNTLTWLDEEHNHQLTIDADLDFLAIMTMARSIYS